MKTKYSLMSGIDDFVLVGSIDKCKDFFKIIRNIFHVMVDTICIKVHQKLIIEGA